MSTIRALFVFLQGFCAVRAAIAVVVRWSSDLSCGRHSVWIRPDEGRGLRRWTDGAWSWRERSAVPVREECTAALRTRTVGSVVTRIERLSVPHAAFFRLTRGKCLWPSR